MSDAEKFRAGPSWTGCAYCGASGWNTTYSELHHAETCRRDPGALVVTDVDAEAGIITVQSPSHKTREGGD